MKKLVSFALSVAYIFSMVCALAEFDIGGLQYDELAQLVNDAQMAMMQSDKWQEVIVPSGIYIIGEDIPEGKWNIKAIGKSTVFVYVGREMYNEFTVHFDDFNTLYGEESSMYDEGDTTNITYNLKNGMYLQIKGGSAAFTPYKGNSFSFK